MCTTGMIRACILSSHFVAGVFQGALLAFVNELGVTKSPSIIDVKRFEQVVRKYLETTVPRLMLVLDPIRVEIENLSADYIEMVDLPFSKDPSYGVHILPYYDSSPFGNLQYVLVLMI